MVDHIQGVQVGFIKDASWQPASTSSSILVYGSCNECLCIMFNSSQSILSLNCYQNKRTCLLFVNYSQNIADQMVDNPGVIFYFLNLPPTVLTNLFWPFDGSINEVYNRMYGTSTGNISFVSPGIYGRGSAIYFNQTQYLNMSSPYFILSSNSFSFEMWIYRLLLNNDADYGSGLLGQCQATDPNTCLHLEIRNLKPYFAFYFDDCAGSTVLVNKTWYHLAFVYDAISGQQSIFVNGKLDCNRTANALQITTNTPLTIGVDLLVQGSVYRCLNGYMDQLSYVNRAKNISEIQDDATLIVYFSFNQASLLDSGPNHINGTAYGATLIDDAILFNRTFSAFQIETFDTSDISQSSSFAFWINPLSTNRSTIVHVLYNITTNNSLCWNMIGFDSQNHLISQIPINGTVSIIGPLIDTNVWTHVVQTYSLINGLSLYINGTFINGTGPINYTNPKQTQTITLGNCSQACPIYGPSSILASPYIGLIDEFRIYCKELSLPDIQSLIHR